MPRGGAILDSRRLLSALVLHPQNVRSVQSYSTSHGAMQEPTEIKVSSFPDMCSHYFVFESTPDVPHNCSTSRPIKSQISPILLTSSLSRVLRGLPFDLGYQTSFSKERYGEQHRVAGIALPMRTGPSGHGHCRYSNLCGQFSGQFSGSGKQF